MIKPTEKPLDVIKVNSHPDTADQSSSYSGVEQAVGDLSEHVLLITPSISDAIIAGQKRYLDHGVATWGIVHEFGAARYEERYSFPLLYKKSPAALRLGNTAVRVKFERYRNAWQEKSLAMSSLADMAMLDEYQHIIGLGPQAVPFLIEELRHELDHWFWALKAIVGEDHAAGASTMKDAAAMWIDWYDSLE